MCCRLSFVARGWGLVDMQPLLQRTLRALAFGFGHGYGLMAVGLPAVGLPAVKPLSSELAYRPSSPRHFARI